jgi:hypothetical protein
LLLEDPVRALFELYASTRGENSDTAARPPIEEAHAKPSVEPTIFNADIVATGPHADQILVDPNLLDPEAEEALFESEPLREALGSAVNAASEDAAHNEQILQGKTAKAEDPSIGPAQVDPESHPPTD